MQEIQFWGVYIGSIWSLEDGGGGGERNVHGEVGSVSLGRVERAAIYSLRGDCSGFINGWGDDWRCYCSGLWKGGC